MRRVVPVGHAWVIGYQVRYVKKKIDAWATGPDCFDMVARLSHNWF